MQTRVARRNDSYFLLYSSVINTFSVLIIVNFLNMCMVMDTCVHACRDMVYMYRNVRCNECDSGEGIGTRADKNCAVKRKEGKEHALSNLGTCILDRYARWIL